MHLLLVRHSPLPQTELYCWGWVVIVSGEIGQKSSRLYRRTSLPRLNAHPSERDQIRQTLAAKQRETHAVRLASDANQDVSGDSEVLVNLTVRESLLGLRYHNFP